MAIILTCSQCEDGTYTFDAVANVWMCDNVQCDHTITCADIEPNLEVGEHLTVVAGRLAYLPIGA